MTLRERLYHFCNQHDLEDLSCIVHFAVLNYVTIHPSKSEWIHLSSQVLDSFIGIGEEKTAKLLDALSDGESVRTYIAFSCLDNEAEFCKSISLDEVQEEFEEEGSLGLDCVSCGKVHTIDNIEECPHHIGYEGNREKMIEELRLTHQEIANELVVLNTNEQHLEKLANIITSRLGVEPKNREDTKGAVIKMLSTVKDFSGLVAGISEDASKTVTSVRKIVENVSGIATLMDAINGGQLEE